MTPALRSGIARVELREGGRVVARGTAFLVTRARALTALHVVADTGVRPPRPREGRLFLVFPAGEVEAVARPDAFDAAADWVLLDVDAPAGATPLPLAAGASGARLEAFGFPDAQPLDGLVVEGRVVDAAASYLGQPVLQLFCEQAAAGAGMPAPGLSGAPVLVDGAVAGLLRAALADGPRTVAGTLYACPVERILEHPAAAELPVLDPLAGLPGLPRVELPSEPFRELAGYGPRDAELFAGRGAELRALYHTLVAPDAAPIVLVYGQSGVGKSSLLEAGLWPRLAWTHTVCGARRDAAMGLSGTLERALGIDAPAVARGHALDTGGGASAGVGALASAWRALEARLGRPVVAWVDQLEEAWTHVPARVAATDEAAGGGATGPDTELAGFVERLAALFADPARRPAGKLVLGFRKEWLPEVEAALGARGLPFARCFVTPVGRAAVVEIVLALTRTERLRRHYGLSLEAGLADAVAEHVCADSGSPVTPTLQLLLTRMWREATARSVSSPRFDAETLRASASDGDYLAEFLDAQVARVAERHPDAAASGLLLELLAAHTTALGTAAERAQSELAATYAQVPAEALDALRGALVEARLLVDAAGGDGRGGARGPETRRRTRLVHDTLAPLVRLRFERSQAPGQRARRILEARSGPPAPLSPADAALVRAGLGGMRALSDAERELLRVTEEAEARARAEQARIAAELAASEAATRAEAARRRKAERRTRNALAAGVVALLAGTAATTWLALDARRAATTRARQLAEALFTEAQREWTERADVGRALLGVAAALDAAPEDWPRRDLYVARAAHLAALAPEQAVSLGAPVAAATSLTAESRRVLVALPWGDLLVYDAETGAKLRALEGPEGPFRRNEALRGAAPLPPLLALSPSGAHAAAVVWFADLDAPRRVLAWDVARGDTFLHAALPEAVAGAFERDALTVSDDGEVTLSAPDGDTTDAPDGRARRRYAGWSRAVPADRPPERVWASGDGGAQGDVPTGDASPAVTDAAASTPVEWRDFLAAPVAGGRALALVGRDDGIRVVDASGGRPVRPLVRAPAAIVRADVTADGAHVRTLLADGVLLTWSSAPMPGDAPATPPATIANGRVLLAAALSPDTRRVVFLERGVDGAPGETLRTWAVDAPTRDGASAQPRAGDAPLPLAASAAFTAASLVPMEPGDAAREPHVAVDDAGRPALAVVGQQPAWDPQRGDADENTVYIRALGPRVRWRFADSDLGTSFLDDRTELVTLEPARRWLVTCNAQTCSTDGPGDFERHPRDDDARRAPIPLVTAQLDAATLGLALAAATDTLERGAAAPPSLRFVGARWVALGGDVPRWVDGTTGLELTLPRTLGADERRDTVAVSPDGRTLAATTWTWLGAGRSRLDVESWDLATGGPLGLPLARGRQRIGGLLDGGARDDVSLLAARFSPDGQWLVTVSSDGAVRRAWVLQPGADARWVAPLARALTGHRRAGSGAVAPLNPTALASDLAAARAALRAAAAAGDTAARRVLHSHLGADAPPP